MDFYDLAKRPWGIIRISPQVGRLSGQAPMGAYYFVLRGRAEDYFIYLFYLFIWGFKVHWFEVTLRVRH
jgi:hypothetical protein